MRSSFSLVRRGVTSSFGIMEMSCQLSVNRAVGGRRRAPESRSKCPRRVPEMSPLTRGEPSSGAVSGVKSGCIRAAAMSPVTSDWVPNQRGATELSVAVNRGSHCQRPEKCSLGSTYRADSGESSISASWWRSRGSPLMGKQFKRPLGGDPSRHSAMDAMCDSGESDPIVNFLTIRS
ncbi:hypothetical protein NOCA2270150 [metagenome]|uniref:Uncharacterized protein n=1 Tax=metagenome TaxID=256318 RepID=A0A2P2C0I1_9ZZZZ